MVRYIFMSEPSFKDICRCICKTVGFVKLGNFKHVLSSLSWEGLIHRLEEVISG